MKLSIKNRMYDFWSSRDSKFDKARRFMINWMRQLRLQKTLDDVYRVENRPGKYASAVYNIIYRVGIMDEDSFQLLRYYFYQLIKYFDICEYIGLHNPVAMRAASYLVATTYTITALTHKSLTDQEKAVVKTGKGNNKVVSIQARRQKRRTRRRLIGMKAVRLNNQTAEFRTKESAVMVMDERKMPTRKDGVHFNLETHITSILANNGYRPKRSSKVNVISRAHTLNEKIEEYLKAKIGEINKHYEKIALEVKVQPFRLKESANDESENIMQSVSKIFTSGRAEAIKETTQNQNVEKWMNAAADILLKFQNDFILKSKQDKLEQISSEVFSGTRMRNVDTKTIEKYLEEEYEVYENKEVTTFLDDLKTFFVIPKLFSQWFFENEDNVAKLVDMIYCDPDKLGSCESKHKKLLYLEKVMMKKPWESMY